MTKMLRTFIAVELTPEIHSRLGELQEKLKAANADIRWVVPENIHVTLKFLGQTTEEQLNSVKKALDRVAQGLRPFTVKVKGIGVFPKPSFPRVIWVGVEEGAEELARINAAIEGEMERLGFERETREFTAHLTLGRVKSPKNKEKLREAIESTEFAPEEIHEVKKLTFFQSTLTPKGSIYTILSEHPVSSA